MHVGMKRNMQAGPKVANRSDAARVHRREVALDAAVVAGTSAGGAALGAAVGAIAGPPGAIAGAIVGGAIGAAASTALEREMHRQARHDKELDDDIGVTSANLGAAPVKNVPLPEPPIPDIDDEEK